MSMTMERLNPNNQVSTLHNIIDTEIIKRKEIWMCDLNGASGSEIFGQHPCIVVSNDIGNKYSPVVTILILTSKVDKKRLPVHVYLDAIENGLDRNSVVLAEQSRALDKWKFLWKLTQISEERMMEVEDAMLINLGINRKYN